MRVASIVPRIRFMLIVRSSRHRPAPADVAGAMTTACLSSDETPPDDARSEQTIQ
jgi:hypothetical protein